MPRAWMEPKEITVNPKKPKIKSHRYDFVLMDLKVVSLINEKEREIVGWWTGNSWEGARLFESDKVTAWKKRYGA